MYPPSLKIPPSTTKENKSEEKFQRRNLGAGQRRGRSRLPLPAAAPPGGRRRPPTFPPKAPPGPTDIFGFTWAKLTEDGDLHPDNFDRDTNRTTSSRTQPGTRVGAGSSSFIIYLLLLF